MQCPDCDSVDRRGFLKTAALGTAAAAISAAAPRTFTGSSETLVTTLYNSLTPEQKPKVAFPFDHPLRWRFGGRRSFRRTHLLWPSGRPHVRRKARPSEQCLLVSGQTRQ